MGNNVGKYGNTAPRGFHSRLRVLVHEAMSAGLTQVVGGRFAEDVGAQVTPCYLAASGLFNGDAALRRNLQASGTPLPNQALGDFHQFAQGGLPPGNLGSSADRLSVHGANTSPASSKNTSPASGAVYRPLIAFLV
jgi:hypothetical protein